MDIDKYEKSKEFNRNEAIYVLHTIDRLAHDEIATRFQLAIDEISKILETHAKYENAVIGTAG